MDNSFTLLSSIVTKVTKSSKKRAPNKVPTKLALKRNIRRSTIFYNLPKPSSINGLKVQKASETTTSTTSSSPQPNFVIVNDTAITISDSDSVKSQTSECNKENNLNGVEATKQKRSSCLLSTSKFHAIEKWISEIDFVNNDNKSNAYQNVDKSASVKRQDLFLFDDMLSSLKDALKTPISNKEMVKDDLENGKKDAGSSDESDSHEDEVLIISSSSSDVVDESDNSSELSNKKIYRTQKDLSTRLYGDKWKSGSNLPKSEPRYRRNIRDNMDQNTSKTERKPKKSLLYKNPYLDIKQEQPSSLSTNEKKIESPWVKSLKKLCDSDTHSDNSSKRASELLDGVSKLTLSFNDNESNEKRSSKNGLNEPNKADIKLKNINVAVDSDSKNFSHFSDKRGFNINGLKKPNKAGVKSKNLSISTDSDKENFSDFSESSETLEDRLRKKLNLNKKIIKELRDLKISDNASTKLDLNKKTIIPEEKTLKNIKISKKLDISKTTMICTENITKTFENFKINDSTAIPVSERDCNKESDENSKSKTKKDIGKGKTNTGRKNKEQIEQIYSILNNLITKTPNIKHTINSDGIVLKSFLASLSGSVKSTECDPSALIFRNNFKMYKNELAAKLFKLYNKEIFDNRIPEDSPIGWSDRMRGTAGFCYCKKIIRSTGTVERKVRIVLAIKVLDSADRLRDTLIHEMCHAAAWIIDEVANGHGDQWRAWTVKARQVFPELPPIKVCHNYAINTKYTYKCTSCSYSIGRHTKSLNTETKRCGYCYGKFEIFINKTSKTGETKSVPVTPKKEATGFALFVKDNYAVYKTPQLNHAQVMKLLGEKFNELRVSQ